jgi:hypothetical protein
MQLGQLNVPSEARRRSFRKWFLRGVGNALLYMHAFGEMINVENQVEQLTVFFSIMGCTDNMTMTIRTLHRNTYFLLTIQQQLLQ